MSACSVPSTNLRHQIGRPQNEPQPSAHAHKQKQYMERNQKTVIVTGASQGIGAGVVQAFLARGYNVVGTSRSATKSKEDLWQQ
jgi:NADPH:quinone reductase-like Zn-dependent oxidoreductase